MGCDSNLSLSLFHIIYRRPILHNYVLCIDSGRFYRV